MLVKFVFGDICVCVCLFVSNASIRAPIVAVRVIHPEKSNQENDEQNINVQEIIDECINELKKKMKIKDDSSIIQTSDNFFVTSIQRICFPQS